MIRLDPSEEASDMGEEKRFYYLRLMAKPGGKPIKTKFVTWSADDQPSSSSTAPAHDDPVLEVQMTLNSILLGGSWFRVACKSLYDTSTRL